jgi:hypothetical protein
MTPKQLSNPWIVMLIIWALVNGLVPHVFAQSSGSYRLKNYEFGGGGEKDLSSPSYQLMGIVGEVAGEQTSGQYGVNAGLAWVNQANVPGAPTVVNTGNWYNKLQMTINKWSGDPSDTTYTVMASTDNFVSDIRYVQSDQTLSAVLGAEDVQTYSAWGGASGIMVIGLDPTTTYAFRVKSTSGAYTDSRWSANASVATSDLELSFDIDVGGVSDPGETSAPYAVAFGSLTPGTVTTATDHIWMDVSTNAEAGASVYVHDQNAGLKSSSLNYTVPAVSNNLTSVSEGFGLQNVSKAQLSGGPLEYASPFDGTSNSVGAVSTTIREIFHTNSSSIDQGRGAVALKAKVSAVTPGSNDYADTIVMIVSASF